MAREIARDDERHGEEVREAQHIEIALVDRIDRLDHPFWHQTLQERNVPGHDDQERKENPHNREGKRHARLDDELELGGASDAAPCSEYEHQLPGERIE